MKECNHRWYHPFNILTGGFVSYAYKCRLCDEVIISDNGDIPELEEKIKETSTKGKHLENNC